MESLPPIESDAVHKAKLRRSGRQAAAENFRSEYSYGLDTDGKTCICSDNIFSWSEKSCGIMWVGIHGKTSICVVTKAGDLDVNRVHNSLLSWTKEEVLQQFRRSIISEIEDLADESSKLRERLQQSIEAPFGVVSVIPGTGKEHMERVYDEPYETHGYKLKDYWRLKWLQLNGKETSSDELLENDERTELIKKHMEKQKALKERYPSVYTLPPEHDVYDKTKALWVLLEKVKKDAANEIASNDEFDEEHAVQFLQEKMIKDKAFTVDETIQTAISAFQRLFKKNFDADMIEVSVMDPDFFVLRTESPFKDIYIKHLDTTEIKHHLVVINAGRNGSGSPPQNGSGSPPKKKSKG